MRVGLVQVNVTERRARRADGSEPPEQGLLPYSVGLLKSYAVAHAAEQHEWLLPIYRRLPPSAGADALAGADVAAFSIYVWNVRLSLAIAAELKRRQPKTLVVFGGPQVPDRPSAAEAFLREHRFVDIVCHGEGELVFTSLLDRASARDFGDVLGISFLSRRGELVTYPKAPRFRDLDQIPSPYTSGAFDDLFAERPNDAWSMIWETNRGCPFSCSFCDWGSATASKVLRFDMERLFAEIQWMAEQQIGFLWTADANFGALKRDLELAERLVHSHETTGYPASITVQSSKNATERVYQVQKLLQRAMPTYGATLSLQSVNDTTLENIRRANISSESYRELQRRFAAEGVYTYTDLILGLPGETYADFAAGISRIIADGQHNHINLFNCAVLPNAEMGDPEYQARYGMKRQPQVIRSQHEPIEDAEEEVEEYLDIVVSTDALPPADWRRLKVFSWVVNLAYFDRMLQIPLLLLAKRHGWPVHEMVEKLIAADPASHPVTAGLVAALERTAAEIQGGGNEFIPIEDAGGLLWTANMWSLISLARDDRVDQFYAEAGDVLGSMLTERDVDDDRVLLDEALRLNRAALTLPFEAEDRVVVLSHNIWEHYHSLLVDSPLAIEEGSYVYRVNRRGAWRSIDEWSEHLTEAQSKDKRRFLHPIVSSRRGGVRRLEPSRSG